MSSKSRAIYSVIWYAAFAALIYFVTNSVIRIAALFVIVFLTFGAFKIAGARKSDPDEYAAAQRTAVLQLIMAVAVFILYFYLRSKGQ